MSRQILVVDDDPDIREVVGLALEDEGFDVESAEDGEGALDTLDDVVDLVVLDIVLPDIEGREVFRRIRRDRDVPVMFLSRKSDDIDRILGLELGADEYVTKPFNPRELVARVKAVLRRVDRSSEVTDESETDDGADDDELLTYGSLEIDPVERRVFWTGDEVELTKKQFDLLEAMMDRPKKVYSRSELIRKAYGQAVVSEKTIDSHVRRIRDAFDADGAPIDTVRGVGFTLTDG